MKLIAIFALINLVICATRFRHNSIQTKVRQVILQSWAEAAYKWMTRITCTDDGILCGQECEKARHLSKSDIRIYTTELVRGQKYRATFVEGDSNRQKAFHDAVLVLDLFPQTRFGHPILAFYVDIDANSTYCKTTKGFFVGDTAACMQPIYRTKTTYGQDYNFRSRSFVPKSLKCQGMLFLPLVYTEFGMRTQPHDQLECKDIVGFHSQCPNLRSKADTRTVDCKPELTNMECGFLENSLRGRCSTSKTCDQAILLSGGWNRQFSDVDSFDNIFNMKKLLMKHGYNEANIEMFIANGVPKDNSEVGDDGTVPNKKVDYGKNKKDDKPTYDDEIKDDEDSSIPVMSDGDDDYTPPPTPVPYHSSSIKSSMRNHIQTVCDSTSCADTFFIYMNNPVLTDGTSLLWDYYDNGTLTDNEFYTPKELMRDISRCKANRVIIVADQSYGVELVAAAAARSNSLENVIIFTSSQEFSINFAKDKLTHYLLNFQTSDICLKDLKIKFSDDYGLPVFVGNRNEYLLNSTLVGAPCHELMKLNDPSTAKYRGCQLSFEV